MQTQPIRESAILVHLDYQKRDSSDELAEFQHLVISAGARIAQVITGSRHAPDAKYYAGSGKAQQIADAVAQHKADLVIFNHDLTPAQERNLERLCQCRVIDRTRLILDIFASRAQSFAGKLQVELAQLEHMATRLVRGWTHLERQKGGIGLRGPGETQLETDRRLLRQRIKTVRLRLEKVHQQREQARRARTRAHIPTISLVGYTNAGKSSLFNALVSGQAYVADQLFATLDTTLRKLDIPGYGPVLLADTVGFIRDLPHQLVDAFKATLEETRDADLLLHVIDAVDHNREAHIHEVESVLAQIGAEDVPRVEVYNKIDCMPDTAAHLEHDSENNRTRIWLSAAKAIGLECAIAAITEFLQNDIVCKRIELTPLQARLRAWLFEHGAVMSEEFDDVGGSVIWVRLPKRDFCRLFE